jgi:hypothetical protein
MNKVGFSLSESESEPEQKKKAVKLEDVAEETGEVIGKGLKKAWNVTKSFGKGLVDTLENTEGQTILPRCNNTSFQLLCQLRKETLDSQSFITPLRLWIAMKKLYSLTASLSASQPRSR